MKKYSVALFFAALAIGGCKLDNSVSVPVAAFRIVHASPDAPNVDVYANGSVAANNLAYDSSTGYIVAAAGNYEIKVAATGTADYVIDALIGLEAGKNYTIYAIDSLTKIKAVGTVDEFTVPPSDSVKVRFLHLSTNTGAIDVAETGGDVLFANRNFNDQFFNSTYADYVSLPAGTYNLEIRPSGAPVVTLSLPGIVLNGGKVYTIYAKGFTGGTGNQALSAGILFDNP